MPSRKALSRCVIAVAGNLSNGNDQWTTKNIIRWTEYNGGTFQVGVDPTVTHLLATKEHVEKRVPAVKEAMKSKKTHIVTKDWFEDTLEEGRPGEYIPFFFPHLHT